MAKNYSGGMFAESMTPKEMVESVKPLHGLDIEEVYDEFLADQMKAAWDTLEEVGIVPFLEAIMIVGVLAYSLDHHTAVLGAGPQCSAIQSLTTEGNGLDEKQRSILLRALAMFVLHNE